MSKLSLADISELGIGCSEELYKHAFYNERDKAACSVPVTRAFRDSVFFNMLWQLSNNIRLEALNFVQRSKAEAARRAAAVPAVTLLSVSPR